MEHPQTVLLGKILECNISLANAYEQHAERNYILSRWMNLQQSVNVLFDSKGGAGEFASLFIHLKARFKMI